MKGQVVHIRETEFRVIPKNILNNVPSNDLFLGPFPFQIALIAIFAGVILVLLITILVILFRKRICCSNSKHHHDDKDGMDKTSGTSTESSGEFSFLVIFLNQCSICFYN